MEFGCFNLSQTEDGGLINLHGRFHAIAFPGFKKPLAVVLEPAIDEKSQGFLEGDLVKDLSGHLILETT
jgi:hypothetical protein